VKRRQHQEWISIDTWDKLDIRKTKNEMLNRSRTRTLRAKAQEEDTAADKEVKRNIKKDKGEYVDILTREQRWLQGKEIWKICICKPGMSGKFQQSEKLVKDRNGNSLTTTGTTLKVGITL
jgi:hypothetical protein